MSRSWRDRARQVATEVMAQNVGADEETLKKAFFEAYPFGQRRYTPYKIWLEEVKKARARGRHVLEVTGPLFPEASR